MVYLTIYYRQRFVIFECVTMLKLFRQQQIKGQYLNARCSNLNHIQSLVSRAYDRLQLKRASKTVSLQVAVCNCLHAVYNAYYTQWVLPMLTEGNF